MTGDIIPLQGDHREIQSLLPWYLAGTLNAAEMAGVRAHVGVCAECQAELASERRLATGIADLPDEGPALDVDHGFALIRERIERDRRRAAPFAGVVTRLAAARRGWFSGEPWMRWAVAAQACLVLALGAALLGTMQAPDYRALGAAAPADAAGVPTGNVVVIFRPDTTEVALRGILRSAGARLVDGPTAADAYVLHVPAAARAETLAALRGQPQIVLAEPLDAGGGS